MDNGLRGSAEVWNRYLLELAKDGKLPEPTESDLQIDQALSDAISHGCEVALRMIEIDYRKSFDEILLNPDFAKEYDRLAQLYGPVANVFGSLELRLAGLEICKRSKSVAKPASKDLAIWVSQHQKLPQIRVNENPWHLEFPGVYVLFSGDTAVYVSEAEDMRRQIDSIMENPHWNKLLIDRIEFFAMEGTRTQRFKVKAMLAQHHNSILNTPLLKVS
jgi:hypothetical protein